VVEKGSLAGIFKYLLRLSRVLTFRRMGERRVFIERGGEWGGGWYCRGFSPLMFYLHLGHYREEAK
jgi:hypothetical protein